MWTAAVCQHNHERCRVIFLLQGAGVLYQALEHGYENHQKTLLVEAIGAILRLPDLYSTIEPFSLPIILSGSLPRTIRRSFRVAGEIRFGVLRATVFRAGYWWIAGWIAECAWQFLFQLQSRLGMWLCMVALLAAFFSFANALFNVYK